MITEPVPTYKELLQYMANLETNIQGMATARRKQWAEYKTYPEGRAAHRELMLNHNELRRLYQVQRERIRKAIKEIRKWKKIIKPFERGWKRTERLGRIYTDLIQQKQCKRCGYKPGIPSEGALGF